MRERETREQRATVYAWEDTCLVCRAWCGRLGPFEAVTPEARVMVIEAATAYTTGLWRRHVHQYRPLHSAVPSVDVRFAGMEPVNGAHSNAKQHTITISQACAHKSWVIHEVAHLFTPGDHHGSAWRRCAMRMWEDEFGIPVERSRRQAAEHGIELSACPRILSPRPGWLPNCSHRFPNGEQE